MKINNINVKTKSKSYKIYFGDSVINKVSFLIKNKSPETKNVLIICDKKVPRTIFNKLKSSLNKYNTFVYKISVNEKIKTFQEANKIIKKLLKNNFNRSDCVISLGGGVTGDLSAFVSSITKRGIKFINIPTTLLAQADASIGGKTGVNSSEGKNLIGTFYQPEFVIIDTSTLKSLPKREMVCGYAEILKHSIILDKKFFLWLTKHGKEIINNKNKKSLKKAIIKSCKIKAKIVSKDEKEKNLRMILNFGHTFAHGFESANNFSSTLNHGEAVLIGMLVASKFSYERKILSLKELSLLKRHYLDLGLPFKVKKFIKKNKINKIIYHMKKDKKNLSEKINLILLKKIGKTTKPNNLNFKDRDIKKFLAEEYI
tara:strand:- start:799 stop:1911 length:1113 start_codon:yes stop_codon:yes gene_type:complete